MSTAVNLIFRGFRQRPPPFADLLFDAELANPGLTTLWFLLPLYLDATGSLESLRASSVEVSEFKGRGCVRLARFLGSGSFQLLRIAAGVRVKLAMLPMTVVGALPAGEIVLPALTAGTLRIGEHPAEKWLPMDLTMSSDVEAGYEPGAIVASQDVPGGGTLPVSMAEVQLSSLHVKVART